MSTPAENCTVELRELTAFFVWAAWASAAERPGTNYSYTNNFPYDPLVGNYPTGATVLWSAVSLRFLLGGIGIVLFAFGKFDYLGWHGGSQQAAPGPVIASAAQITPAQAVLPSNLLRAWHLQLAIFWVATSYVGGALYVASSLGGGNPKGQRTPVHLLSGALVLVVVGSLFGRWPGIKDLLGDLWFWIGNQG